MDNQNSLKQNDVYQPKLGTLQENQVREVESWGLYRSALILNPGVKIDAYGLSNKAKRPTSSGRASVGGDIEDVTCEV